MPCAAATERRPLLLAFDRVALSTRAGTWWGRVAVWRRALPPDRRVAEATRRSGLVVGERRTLPPGRRVAEAREHRHHRRRRRRQVRQTAATPAATCEHRGVEGGGACEVCRAVGAGCRKAEIV